MKGTKNPITYNPKTDDYLCEEGRLYFNKNDGQFIFDEKIDKWQITDELAIPIVSKHNLDFIEGCLYEDWYPTPKQIVEYINIVLSRRPNLLMQVCHGFREVYNKDFATV